MCAASFAWTTAFSLDSVGVKGQGARNQGSFREDRLVLAHEPTYGFVKRDGGCSNGKVHRTLPCNLQWSQIDVTLLLGSGNSWRLVTR
ncbi:hypothetical protein P171DRAFT_179770 [Karstenula rhodostoma CBS 690.94]|uniref:Uncharacterized protein n=1 Tax=Karstenula rhodostoma CBS 690.94 TaxID=1392251 RepID=A0A9P4P723_9PLEO|nr:hypothetical protein P171DRAFT_179770 [Karstenula rhodostoma CBS 690.94]